MDIWIIKDGGKHGPFQEYEVRGRIDSGDLSGDTPTWHEGLEGWRPLRELPLFAREFERLEALRKMPPEPVRGVPPLQGDGRPFMVRRFWARWFDLYLFSGVWWIVMWAAGRDIGAILNNPWMILSMYLPWFALEALLLQRWGTTPGKWLLGIRVVNDDGSLMSLPESIRRAARVLFLGVGFGWGLLALICQLLAFFTTRRIGRPLWDHAGGHQLQAAPLHPLRLTGYVIALFAALQLQLIVVAPYVMERMKKEMPAFSEPIEKNPPWHLPVRR